MHAVGSSGKHIFWMGQQTPVACYRKGGCTPEGIPVNPAPEWWGVGPNNPPALNDRITANSQVIWDTLSKYPYPAPFLPGEGVSFFLSKLKPDLMGVAASQDNLDPDTLRLWITLQVLANYDGWTQMMQAAAEQLAKRRKKIAIRNAIVATVGSFIVSFAAPAAIMAILTAVKAAAQYYVDAKNAKAAAKSLREASAAFATSDPEFSKEVDRAVAYMDNLAAEAEAEAQAKIQAVAPKPGASSTSTLPAAPAGGPSLTTSLAVGGGVAAIGLVVLSLIKP